MGLWVFVNGVLADKVGVSNCKFSKKLFLNIMPIDLLLDVFNQLHSLPIFLAFCIFVS